jgi:hypothetical protein
MLLEAAHFVDEAFEDAADGGRVEGGLGLGSEALEDAAFSLRIVDGHLTRAFDVPDGEDEPHAFGHELEDLPVDFVDGDSERFDFRRGHPTIVLPSGEEREPKVRPGREFTG